MFPYSRSTSMSGTRSAPAAPKALLLLSLFSLPLITDALSFSPSTGPLSLAAAAPSKLFLFPLLLTSSASALGPASVSDSGTASDLATSSQLPEVSNLVIPESLGLWRSMQWCSQGLVPSIQRIATTLMNSNIPPYVLDSIKNEYFGSPPSAADDPDAPFDIFSMFAAMNDYDDDGAKTPSAASPFQTMMSLAPLVSDLVLSGNGDDVESMTHTDKMESYSERICRLADAEAAFTDQLDSQTPISCALIDLVHTVVACNAALPDSQDEFNSHRGQQCHNEPVNIPTLPDHNICQPAPDTFQAQQGLPAFRFDDPNVDIPLTLQKLDRMPSYIPDSVRQKELLTYLTLYRANQMLSHLARIPHDHTQCVAQTVQQTNILPGWNVIQVFNAVEVPPPEFGGLRSEEPEITPYSLLFKRKSSPCQFALGVRGSKTLHEWTTAFDLARNDDPLINGTHSGVLSFVSKLLPSVITVLERETAAENCGCEDTSITFFGHSLGGAVSQVLSLAIGERLKTKECSPEINGVFFAPLRMFNRKQLQVYKEVVNSRHITDQNDALHHFPCFEGNSKHGFPRCPSDFNKNRVHAGAFSKAGRDYYVENPSQILLNVDYRAMRRERHGVTHNLSDGWFIKTIRESYPMVVGLISAVIPPSAMAALPTRYDLNSAHICSHACALSAACVQNADTEPFRWWCESCRAAMFT